MRSIHSTLLKAAVLSALAAALSLGAVDSAAAQGPGYGTPSYAPTWFQNCTNPKQWAQWQLDTQGVLTMTDWGNNYGSQLATPVLTLSPDFLSVWMDNDPQSDHYKQVWFEMTWDWTGAPPSFGPVTLSWYGQSGAVALFTPQPGPVGPGLGQGYYVDSNAQKLTFYWEIFPQPDWERLSLTYSGVVVSNIVMLTQCNPIPEPAFLQLGALLGLSALGMVKVHRR